MVDSAIQSFATGLLSRYSNEVNDPEGVINAKKNNCFMAELGEEFMFYSAFVRSFDSSFGNVLEKLGNNIATLSYTVKGNINSFILPEQIQRTSSILDGYFKHEYKPAREHYESFSCLYQKTLLASKQLTLQIIISSMKKQMNIS